MLLLVEMLQNLIKRKLKSLKTQTPTQAKDDFDFNDVEKTFERFLVLILNPIK